MTNKETGNDVDPTKDSIVVPSEIQRLITMPIRYKGPFMMMWEAMQAEHKREQEMLAQPDYGDEPVRQLMRRCGRL